MVRALSLWLPVVAWMGLIFWLSSLSDLGAVGRLPDWIGHGLAFMGLCVLLCRALAGGWRGFLPGSYAFGAVVLCVLYGASDEYHQRFVPGRTAELADVAKDLAGAVIGAWLSRRIMIGEAPHDDRP